MAVAQQVLITMVDDLDGTEEDVETVRFGLDGKEYEIDLSGPNGGKLRAVMAPYVKSARPAARASRQASRRQQPDRPNPIAVREWAKGRGIKVNDRGRVPVDITRQYLEANA
jgi:Lsr2